MGSPEFDGTFCLFPVERRTRSLIVKTSLDFTTAGSHMSEYPTVVIGAGPYGLSVAAHLNGARVPTLIFGKPMEFWQSFPRGMNLRSAWSASSLSDPEGAYSLDRFPDTVAGQA